MDTDDQLTLGHLASELRLLATDMHTMKRMATIGMWFGGLVITAFITLGAYIVTSVIEHNLQIRTLEAGLKSHEGSATPHPAQLLIQGQVLTELALIKQQLANDAATNAASEARQPRR